ncbi:MAG: Eco57I restriction-modification methylase domain-containing protein [Nannocystaceae bacterium]
MTADVEAALACAAQAADALRERAPAAARRSLGQFFTPVPVARLMASWIERPASEPVRVLDPGAGAGVLGLACAAHLLSLGSSVELTAIERDAAARARLEAVLDAARRRLGARLRCQISGGDALALRPGDVGSFDVVIANPPYLKMAPADPRGGDSPNAYTRFMEVAAGLLRPRGQLCFLVPRSFAAGLYFRRFRRRFHAEMALTRAHVFRSRRDAFREDRVLQETVVVLYRKQPPGDGPVALSTSTGARDLDAATRLLTTRARLLDPADPDAPLLLPTCPKELAMIAAARALPHRLADHGLSVSTGPVVPFRARPLLRRAAGPATAPLLWMQHVRPEGVTWPLGAAFRKPEHLRADAPPALLVPSDTFVLLRRLSSKEERRRLCAAALVRGQLPGATLGLENHLNYVHRAGGGLTRAEARGLAALFNAAWMDRYFRVANGSTQVNATDLRALPLPTLAALRRLGGRAPSEDAIAEALGV